MLNVAEVDSVTRGDVVGHDGAVRLEQAPSVNEVLGDESFAKTIIEVPAVAHFDEVGGVAQPDTRTWERQSGIVHDGVELLFPIGLPVNHAIKLRQRSVDNPQRCSFGVVTFTVDDHRLIAALVFPRVQDEAVVVPSAGDPTVVVPSRFGTTGHTERRYFPLHFDGGCYHTVVHTVKLQSRVTIESISCSQRCGFSIVLVG